MGSVAGSTDRRDDLCPRARAIPRRRRGRLRRAKLVPPAGEPVDGGSGAPRVVWRLWAAHVGGVGFWSHATATAVPSKDMERATRHGPGRFLPRFRRRRNPPRGAGHWMRSAPGRRRSTAWLALTPVGDRMTEGAAPMQAVDAVVVAVLRPKIEPINSTEEACDCVFRHCDPDSLSVNSRQPQSGGLAGIRTRDQRLKRPLLYR